MLPTITRLAIGSILLLALTGCPGGSVTSVTITGGDRTLPQGTTLTLTATVEVTGNASTTVTWSSSNTSVATIDATGTIATLTTGNTIITATSTTDPNKNDSITLTITEANTVTSVTISGGDQSTAVDGNLTLTATVIATGTASTTVTWTSSNSSVATIGADGTITSLTTGTTIITATSTVDPTKSDSINLTVNPPGTLAWARQFGTSSHDFANAIATDAHGNVYVIGESTGALEGANAGGTDAFIRSYDSKGTLRWTRQFGTSSDDHATGVATDAAGNVYAAGSTRGDLNGANAGNADAFIRSYDSNGAHRWTRQFGTSSTDRATGVATDAHGNVYASGYTYGALEGSNAGNNDAFIRSYDSTGILRWTRQFGTSGSDTANAVATDTNGSVYTAGYTNAALEGASAGNIDAFVRAYSSDGDLRWTRQFGSSSWDPAYGVATDSDGHVYVVGDTYGVVGETSAGSSDAFISSYDSDGNPRWIRQFGAGSAEFASGVAVSPTGYVYAVGKTSGALEGTSSGNDDATVPNINILCKFGTSSTDRATGVATDANGNVNILAWKSAAETRST
jgi:hypothetical protein